MAQTKGFLSLAVGETRGRKSVMDGYLGEMEKAAHECILLAIESEQSRNLRWLHLQRSLNPGPIPPDLNRAAEASLPK